jgi:biotin carboxylase
MSHIVFVETSGSGLLAMEYARAAGHTVTYLYSSRYDFTASPRQRERARATAHCAVPLGAGRDAADLMTALRNAGVRLAGVDAVLSTLAFGVPMAAELARALGVRGTPAEAVAAARDKVVCREILRDNGIASIPFAVANTAGEALAAAAHIGYPVVVKPALGVAKAATVVAHGPDDVRRHFAGLGAEMGRLQAGLVEHVDERFIVEQFAVGELYSVEVAADSQRFVPLAATVQKTGRDNPVLELGATAPPNLDSAAQRELGDYACAVCRVLGLNIGVFHVEAIGTADGFRLTEANPRIAGGSLPETVNATGSHDVFATLVDVLVGGRVPAEPPAALRAVSHSVLAAAEPSSVRGDLRPDWFEAFSARIHSGWARAAAGDRLPAMRGNFDRFGMIRVAAADPVAARRECLAVKRDIERELGFALAADSDDKSITAADAERPAAPGTAPSGR